MVGVLIVDVLMIDVLMVQPVEGTWASPDRLAMGNGYLGGRPEPVKDERNYLNYLQIFQNPKRATYSDVVRKNGAFF